jgi:hypothetical protein
MLSVIYAALLTSVAVSDLNGIDCMERFGVRPRLGGKDVESPGYSRRRTSPSDSAEAGQTCRGLNRTTVIGADVFPGSQIHTAAIIRRGL